MVEQRMNSVLEQASALEMQSAETLLACFFLALLTLMWAEKKRPRVSPPGKLMKRSYLTNLETFVFNDVTLSLMQIPALYLVAAAYSDRGLLSDMENGPVKFAIAFLLLDLVMYGWHVLSHHCDWLWIFHRVHHSDRSMNVTTALRYHPGELVLEALLRAVFIIVVGVDTETVLACQGVMSLFILFHHSNIGLPGERWLSLVFIVPGIHRLHHSVIRAEHDSNYGAVLSIWDRMFGSLRLTEPKALGLYGVDEDTFASILRDVLPVHRLLQPGVAAFRHAVPLRIPVRRDSGTADRDPRG